MHRTDPDNAGKAQLGELAFAVVVFGMVEFVDHEDDRTRGAAQLGRQLGIERQQAVLAIENKKHHVRPLDRLIGRAMRGLGKVRIGRRADTAGVHDAERRPPQIAHRLDAVAGHAGLVVDNGNAPPGQTVEERGLSHIGTPDENDLLHVARSAPPSEFVPRQT